MRWYLDGWMDVCLWLRVCIYVHGVCVNVLYHDVNVCTLDYVITLIMCVGMIFQAHVEDYVLNGDDGDDGDDDSVPPVTPAIPVTPATPATSCGSKVSPCR